MWTPATRRQSRRYETDLTDAEWRLVAPLLPAPKRTGRPLSWPLREIVNAIFHVMRGGVAWRLLPSDRPPRSTVYRWFAAWRDGGVFEALNHALLMIDRERSGRAASPSACIIDSQRAKTNEAGGPRGYDAGKKIMGRKRHALVGTDGWASSCSPILPAFRIATGGSAAGRLAAHFPSSRRSSPTPATRAPRVATATRIAVEIVRRKPDQISFAIPPRRWSVERFFAWIKRDWWLWKDAEVAIASATALLYAAAAMILIRRIARGS
ncbi:transposase, IS4 family [Bosea lathyri]|uniref:Transposase, IS4 family n=1 Tax=Bosea lathyri TaxID=1036778 RepID=A0A1H6CQE0_9HYPH|nr:transposase, IS4 family [Bosea lathyri]